VKHGLQTVITNKSKTNTWSIDAKTKVHQVKKAKQAQIKQALTNVGCEHGCEIRTPRGA